MLAATQPQEPLSYLGRPLQFERGNLADAEMLALYRALLTPRMIEEKMLILLRQNKISKWFSGIGQEAISVGLTLALESDDYIFPLHRNLGVFTSRGMELHQLFAQWQGKQEGFTQGRDRSFHFGSLEHRVVGMISHLGAMLGVADGVALASNLRNESFIAAVFSGDGGASEGDFHEALNVAAVWELPVIFVLENNGYGLSTPSREQFRCKQFIDKALGYGMRGVQVDGNNVLEVYQAVTELAEQMREDRQPVLLECMTFRMRGHEEASGTKYVPKELMQEWAHRDPVTNYENYLLAQGLLTPASVQTHREEIKHYIEASIQQVFDLPEITAGPTRQAHEVAQVYAPQVAQPPATPPPPGERSLRLVDALTEALDQAMAADPHLVLMGQDIADYGGVFKVTQGLMEKYGKARVRNTPLCESAIVAAAMGLSLQGHPSMVEMQFADFVSCGFNQIVNNLAKNHYRWGHAPRVTVRMPTGAGVAAGPFHSQSNEAWFFHVPGLTLVYPATPYDAKGLLLASLSAPGPVLFFEHKVLYRSLEGPVPAEHYEVPIGKGRLARPGTDATVVTYGMGVHWAEAAADALAHEASVEVIDLRSLLPWDKELVYDSVRRTGKCLVLHEDTLTGGIGAEIAACIQEDLFGSLDAPVFRVGSLDTPVPFHAELEKQFLPRQRLTERLQTLVRY